MQGMNYRFDLAKIIGLNLILIGISIRSIAKKTLGRYYLYGLKILRDHRFIERFGIEYLEYVKKTKRLIPHIY